MVETVKELLRLDADWQAQLVVTGALVVFLVITRRLIIRVVNQRMEDATIRFYTEVLNMRLAKIVTNRDEPTSTHIFLDMGGGNMLAFFDFPEQSSAPGSGPKERMLALWTSCDDRWPVHRFASSTWSPPDRAGSYSASSLSSY